MAKFRIAPLDNEDKMRIIFDANNVTNEHARVPGGPSQEQPSHVNLGEDEADSGCGGSPDVTPIVAQGWKEESFTLFT